MIIELWRTAAKVWCVFLFMAFMTGCGSSDAEQRPAVTPARPVKAVQLTRKAQSRPIQMPGVAQAVRDTDLSFRVGGPLIELSVDTGDFVKKGQVAARIDPRDFEIGVTSCKARLSSSRAHLAEAKLQYSRHAKLVKEKAVSQSEYDRVKAVFEMAAAQEQADAKALENARNALADTVLKAPFAGYINERFADNHETVKAGQPVASLVDLSSMEVRLALSEDMLTLLPRFQRFTCAFSAIPGRSFSASIKEVGKKADPASRTYPLILTLGKSALSLVRPGMSAEVTALLSQRPGGPGFVVPLSALSNRIGQQAFVWVVDAQSGKLSQVPVRIVRLLKDGAEVSGKLCQGQWIVTAGVSGLQENQTVRLLQKPSKTNIGLEL